MAVLVVGASSGIGKAIATGLIESGVDVISASRNRPSINGIVHHNLDVTDPSADLSFIPDVLEGLVYCPGSINLKPFHRLKEEDFQKDLDINVLGAIRVLQAAFKALKKSDGASVVLFSTVAAKLGMNFHASIATSKAALEGLGKSLAAEWSAHNICVNILAPSLTDTPLASQLLSNEDRREASNKRHPIGRFGKAEDLSNLAQFLLSKESSWITGQVIGVDGGMGSLKP
ncbi:NAD(P)-dependent dehydrogenase (short-subunit alcohol dehydrogenase family) [Roseivirga pacifica]|uniref:NAD(P)-dependent dehydrogenase, short-chain alcohol dehydrogenase family n=1 Tax=Roseivirga pacifica TaxID=1267423 RepID=A0A1I0R664_9BACT|nr:SDR family oxidoreductase [Roseivirga pacifica]RKQ49100.1 NAD(P)-dependent dehydrogenase (short-subunit alcohol dehydrogenase family) [Roseivirga pacifica]SEW36097.1 NAD(P)-dependent dehydrogenase, short-chain alcohol dehydrogenase family [Roseivirga pacifica]